MPEPIEIPRERFVDLLRGAGLAAGTMGCVWLMKLAPRTRLRFRTARWLRASDPCSHVVDVSRSLPCAERAATLEEAGASVVTLVMLDASSGKHEGTDEHAEMTEDERKTDHRHKIASLEFYARDALGESELKFVPRGELPPLEQAPTADAAWMTNMLADEDDAAARQLLNDVVARVRPGGVIIVDDPLPPRGLLGGVSAGIRRVAPDAFADPPKYGVSASRCAALHSGVEPLGEMRMLFGLRARVALRKLRSAAVAPKTDAAGS